MINTLRPRKRTVFTSRHYRKRTGLGRLHGRGWVKGGRGWVKGSRKRDEICLLLVIQADRRFCIQNNYVTLCGLNKAVQGRKKN